MSVCDRGRSPPFLSIADGQDVHIHPFFLGAIRPTKGRCAWATISRSCQSGTTALLMLVARHLARRCLPSRAVPTWASTTLTATRRLRARYLAARSAQGFGCVPVKLSLYATTDWSRWSTRSATTLQSYCSGRCQSEDSPRSRALAIALARDAGFLEQR